MNKSNNNPEDKFFPYFLIFILVILWHFFSNIALDLVEKSLNLSSSAIEAVYLESQRKFFNDNDHSLMLSFVKELLSRFSYKHSLLLIGYLFISPFVVGLTIGRNYTAKTKYVIATIITFFACHPFKFFNANAIIGFFNVADFSIFILALLLGEYMIICIFILPFLVVTYLGLFVGGYFYDGSKQTLIIQLYGYLKKRSKYGLPFLVMCLFLVFQNFWSAKQFINDKVLNYRKLFYAPIHFNQDKDDIKLIQVGNRSIDNEWHESIILKNDDTFDIFLHYYNNDRLYKAMNTRATLAMSEYKSQIGQITVTATLWADNAKSIHDSATIFLECAKRPYISFVGSSWNPNPNTNRTQPLPLKQHGDELETSEGVNFGDIEGLSHGAFVARYHYSCR